MGFAAGRRAGTLRDFPLRAEGAQRTAARVQPPYHATSIAMRQAAISLGEIFETATAYAVIDAPSTTVTLVEVR